MIRFNMSEIFLKSSMNWFEFSPLRFTKSWYRDAGFFIIKYALKECASPEGREVYPDVFFVAPGIGAQKKQIDLNSPFTSLNFR